MKKILFAAAVAGAFGAAYSAGFGIYEASARGNAMGGALVGSTKDASASYYNPANMTESTNVSVLVGVTFITPFCDTTVDGERQQKMDAGWFCVPTFYFSVPLPFDFAVGGGTYCEYGLGTKYAGDWALAGDTIETTMMQYTFNPNLSWKVTDWWSIAGGLRLSYIQFNNKKHPHAGEPLYLEQYRRTLPGSDYYHLESELDGDDTTLGYNFGTTFKALDNLSFGIVYRSPLKHKIAGDFDLDGYVNTPMGRTAQHAHLPASAKLKLPQSLSMGVNWDATEKWHLGFVATWTEWSSVDNIKFEIPGYGYNLPLRWKDVWRFGWGVEYDLTEDVSLRGSYVYDVDPTGTHGTTMLPSGDRHILGVGFGWNIWSTLRLDVGYNLILMEDSDRNITLTTLGGETYTKHFSADNSMSHLISASLSYSF